MTTTPEQKRAFAILENTLHPPRIADLAMRGSRDNWVELDRCLAAIRPLFNDAPVETSKQPEVRRKPRKPRA